MKDLTKVALIVAWISGVVLAKGFFSAIVAYIFPFWAWYLVIEKVIT